MELLPIVRKSSIRGLIVIARAEERNNTEKECEEKFRHEKAKMEGLFELKLQELHSEVEMLGRVIEKQNLQIREAQEKEIEAKKIYLKAREIVTCVDYEFKKHTENAARSMAQFTQIRLDAENFSKKLIEG